MKLWTGLLLAAIAAAVAWFALTPPAPPEIEFARTSRQRIESVLATNGKTEPVEWAPVAATRSGRVARVLAEQGERIHAGSPVAMLESSEIESEIAAAEARLAQVRSELAVAEAGGRPAELAGIDAALARLTVEREAAAREAASLERLVSKQAATRAELNAAKDRLASLESQIAGETAKRKALIAPAEIPALRARLRDAEAALRAAKRRLEQATLRAPRSGVVYELPVRAGEWVEAGAVLAKVGEISRLRVIIYVDEPDLGRVRAGMPVVLTWDALPGREWRAEVKSAPVQVATLGTRQVGEVITIAENPNHDLPPGANINAAIRSEAVENALTIPKAALRREAGRFGVYLLDGDRIEWRPVELGVSSATLAEIRDGLKDGDAVALPSDVALAAGMRVRPALKP